MGILPAKGLIKRVAGKSIFKIHLKEKGLFFANFAFGFIDISINIYESKKGSSLYHSKGSSLYHTNPS